ncbi:MAG: hypothetical protein ACXAEU_05295 [Candidatus Hodarchaeales archaeon]
MMSDPKIRDTKMIPMIEFAKDVLKDPEKLEGPVEIIHDISQKKHYNNLVTAINVLEKNGWELVNIAFRRDIAYAAVRKRK